MDRIAPAFDPDRFRKPPTRDTERGDLMTYFKDRLNPARVKDGFQPISMGRMGRILFAIPTTDLYALKSKCQDAERRGFSFAKRFWWETDPRKHAAVTK